jgi:hypothetical protein
MLRVRRDHTRERETLEATVEIVGDEVTGLAMFIADNCWSFTSACVRHDDKETFTFMYRCGRDHIVSLLYVVECSEDSWLILYDYIWSCDNRGYSGHAAIYDPVSDVLITNNIGRCYDVSIASDDSGDIIAIEKEHVHCYERIDRYGDIRDGKILGILIGYAPKNDSIVESHIDSDIDHTVYTFDDGSDACAVRYLSENVIIWLEQRKDKTWIWTVYNMADGSIYHINK